MRKGNKWGKMRCISASLGTADLCQDLPFHSFFYTWDCLASELKIHKANQFILSFSYGSQKEQDIPLYCSTVGSLPSFLFFPPFFLSLLCQSGMCFWRVLYLSFLSRTPCSMAEDKSSWEGSGLLGTRVVYVPYSWNENPGSWRDGSPHNSVISKVGSWDSCQWG